MRTLSISTKLATTCPFEFVIIHDGPGATQPKGVAPAVNHLFAPSEPDTGGFSVIPGEKGLLLRELDPVMLFVMSEIPTIHGELQGTLGFHDPEPTGNEFVPVVVAWTKEVPPSEVIKTLAKITRTDLLARLEPVPAVPLIASVCKDESSRHLDAIKE